MNPGFRSSRALLSRRCRPNGPALALILALLAGAAPARALTIIPVWDSTITNDPDAATIESTINMAIQYYEARFADPITISILFQEMSGGVGASQFEYYNISYGQFITNLQNDATTVNDTNALACLPAGPFNPVTGDGGIYVKSANLKALGLVGYDSGFQDGVEGIVFLNTSVMNLSRAGMDPSKYDLLSAAEHEMNEVLGLGSDLPAVGAPFPEDLFRYTAGGARSFTTNGDDAWFSLDGTNLLVQFNQDSRGDYGDWWSTGAHTPRVQDAFARRGAAPDMGVELIALDVLGYDLLPPPQPGLVNIVLSGTDLVVSGTNGLATGAYYLLGSADMALPLNQWSPLATTYLTANGDFTFTATNAVNPQSVSQFYVLQMQ